MCRVLYLSYFSLSRALVDAPEVTRKIMSFKRLSLTDLKVDIPRLASKKVLNAKLAESGELIDVVSSKQPLGITMGETRRDRWPNAASAAASFPRSGSSLKAFDNFDCRYYA